MADSRDENLFKKYVERMKHLTGSGDEEQILDELSSGKNTYMKMSRLETSSYDPAWIDKIEGVIFDLGDIIANPREVTQSMGDISPIELAKKIKGESVQHLASHTQYIKEVDDYGNVIPSKILSFYNEENIITYENRFIATFVRKLLLFIEKRYEFAVKFARLHDQETLYIKNHSTVDGAEVEIETKVKIVSESQTAASKANNAYFARIEEVREYVRYYYNSPFMKIFKTETNVRNPIVLTNILRKNPKYRHCYEVYKYLESYTGLGIDYRMDENYALLSSEELAELNFSLFGSYLSAHSKRRTDNSKHRVKVYKPKVLTSMDDETFVYGPLLEGPLQFVRVDDGYQRYLESMVPKDLPLHPHRKVREYYAEQYQERKDYRKWLQERDALLRRKQREVKNFELEVQDILAKREAERLRLAELEKALIQKEEEDTLNRIRRQIIEAALRDRMMDTPPEGEFNPEDHIGPMLGEGEPVIQIHQSDVQWDPNDIIPNQEPHNYFHPSNHTGEGALDAFAEGTLTPPGEEVEPLQFKDPSEYKKPEQVEEEQPVEEPAEQEEQPYLDDDALIDIHEEQRLKEEELAAAKAEAEASKPQKEPVRSLLGTHGYRNGRQVRYVVRKIRPDQHRDGHLIDPNQQRKETPVDQTPVEEPVQEAKTPLEEEIKAQAAPIAEQQEDAKLPLTEEPVSQEQSPEESQDQQVEEDSLEEPVQQEHGEEPVGEAAPVEEAPIDEESQEEPIEEPAEESIEEPSLEEGTDGQEASEEEAAGDELAEDASIEASKSEELAEEPVSEEISEEENGEEELVEDIPVDDAELEEPAEEVSIEEPLLEDEVFEDSEEEALEETPSTQPVAVATPVRKRRYVVRKIRPDQHRDGHLIAPLPPTIIKVPASSQKEPTFAVNQKENPAEPAPIANPTEGSFVIKTNEGYYVEDGRYSMKKSDAKVFHDFNDAYAVKMEIGGKVVKV